MTGTELEKSNIKTEFDNPRPRARGNMPNKAEVQVCIGELYRVNQVILVVQCTSCCNVYIYRGEDHLIESNKKN